LPCWAWFVLGWIVVVLIIAAAVLLQDVDPPEYGDDWP
jgi:hypothetical protein